MIKMHNSNIAVSIIATTIIAMIDMRFIYISPVLTFELSGSG